MRIQNFYGLYKKYKIHLIVWFLFIFYEVVIVGLLRGYFATFGNYTLFYVFNIILFYVHAHVAMPAAKLNTKQALWRMPLFVILEIVIYIPIVMLTAAFFVEYTSIQLSGPIIFDNKGYATVAYRATYFILFSSAYYYIVNYFKGIKLAEKLEKERLLIIIENQRIHSSLIKSQHAHLKAQINPHFLFNTLNFIYTNTRKTAPDAAEAIMALSEMMRYSIQEVNDSSFSSLDAEVEQVENLIKLHQIKSYSKLYIHFDYEYDRENIQIIPLVLISLVENIFKHGNLTQEDHHAYITINARDGKIKIQTKNLIANNPAYPSHHIGLDNTKKRLQATYGERATLETEIDAQQCFHVRLEIEQEQVYPA